jgi:hypothetical protein
MVACAALLAALAGCGGDDNTDATTTPTVAETETTPALTDGIETIRERTAETQAQTAPSTETSPEAMPGGAGDEEPARTLALFTAQDGRITPRVVRVPAFIAVKVELHSADGATYALRFGDTTITAGEQFDSVSTTIDGLRPGAAIVGRPQGAGNPVRIEATAEPGP